MRVRHTKEILEKAIQNSLNWREVNDILSSGKYAANQAHLKKQAIKFGITFSHFTYTSWNKGKFFGEKRPIEDYLSNKFRINSNSLKKKLFNNKIKELKCEICLNTEWLNKPIALDLHHIDKNPLNNNLENLLIVCPNCHRAEHKKTNVKKIVKPKIIKEKKVLIKKVKPVKICSSCLICGEKTKNQTKFCSYKCSSFSQRKAERPSKEELEKMIKDKPMSHIGKTFGVSDNSVKKWCKNYGITEFPGRGYWEKVNHNKI